MPPEPIPVRLAVTAALIIEIASARAQAELVESAPVALAATGQKTAGQQFVGLSNSLAHPCERLGERHAALLPWRWPVDLPHQR